MTTRIRAVGARALVTFAVMVALVAGSATAAFALWSTTTTAQASVTMGKVVGTIAGTNSMTTTFSPSVTSLTAPITLSNSGNLRGTYSTTVAVTQGAALANTVRVVAWPVTTASDCTASAAVGDSSVTGTWGSLPSLSGTLTAGAAAIWCTRSAPTNNAPASATTNVQVSLVVANGSWRSTPVTGGFYLNTSAATTAAPAIQCTNPDTGNFHARIAFDTSSRSLDTYYGLQIGSTRIDPAAQGYTGYIDLAGSDVGAGVAADGVVRVDVAVLDSSQNPTGEIAATGTVTLATSNGSRTVTCGG